MMLGYDHQLFLLAFDHRRPHLAQLFGVADDPTPEESARIVAAKEVVFAGFARALADGAPSGEAGILVDEQFGAEVARTALANGWICAMPVERSGARVFEFEYGEDFAAHIEAFDPTFAKVLVRYNVDGSKADNALFHRAAQDALGLAARARPRVPVRADRAGRACPARERRR